MPQVFGIEHIIYFAVTVSLSIAAWIIARKHTNSEKNGDILIKCAAAALLAAIIWNRLSICVVSGEFLRDLLPNTYCGASSLAFSIIALIGKRNCKALHCVAYVGAIGALLTIAYPDFIGQADSIFYCKTISGLAHHSLTLLLFGLMIATGYLKPTLKKWHILPIGLCVYVAYGLVLIQLLDTSESTMYLYAPILEGTFLDWLGIGVIFLPLHTLLLFGWELLMRRKDKRAAE